MGIVQKYGGTSVGTTLKIKDIAKRIVDRKAEGEDLVVVVSAMGKTTDHLIHLARDIVSDPGGRELDVLMSTGEQQTIALLSMALDALGQPSISLTGAQAGIQTLGPHNKNKIHSIESTGIKRHLSEGTVVVVAGFQGVNSNGDITTLGRGGSDTTAVALAAALDFTCEIYTDVDGIYSVDPRAYPKARKLDYLSYEEMLEMASLGAGVLDPRAVELGKKYSVPLYVAKAHGTEAGTLITEATEMEEKWITGLSIGDGILMIAIRNVPYTARHIAYIFTTLADQNVNVDMISQTAPSQGTVDVSFTCPADDKRFVKEALDTIAQKIEGVSCVIDDGQVKLSVVGIGMMNHSGVAASIFELFAENDIAFKQVTTSEISISYTIDAADRQRAVMLIAQRFNL